MIPFNIIDKDTNNKLIVFDKDIAGNYLASDNRDGSILLIAPSKLVDYYLFNGVCSQ
jgi:hypothetical protein